MVGVVVVIVAPSAGLVTTGVEGLEVSTVKVFVFDARVAAPFATVASTRWAPWGSSVAGVQENAPSLAEVVVHARAPSTLTVTVTLEGAVPESCGVVVETTELSAGSSTTGAPPVVSMLNVLVFDGREVLPAVSVAVALTV